MPEPPPLLLPPLPPPPLPLLLLPPLLLLLPPLLPVDPSFPSSKLLRDPDKFGELMVSPSERKNPTLRDTTTLASSSSASSLPVSLTSSTDLVLSLSSPLLTLPSSPTRRTSDLSMPMPARPTLSTERFPPPLSPPLTSPTSEELLFLTDVPSERTSSTMPSSEKRPSDSSLTTLSMLRPATVSSTVSAFPWPTNFFGLAQLQYAP
mmetsp:Transcript_9508/g.28343  ORF Transcript_9508/g.28343 Transcript_9508/m.28343 type:complete len:206 (+) Transcript_9508:302-919(+)